jgi:hypothetical protein
MRPRWRRGFSMVVAAAWFGLSALLLPPAHARGDQDGGAAVPEIASKASTGGTARLVRIGPQALIEVHEDGRMSMVDEPAPQRSRAASLAIFVGTTLGIPVLPLALPRLTGATNPSPAR